MMDERRMMQEALSYGFSFERHIPDGHLPRKIDPFVDLSGLRAHPGRYYSRLRATVDRSRADNADADCRLPPQRSLGAAALR
jgi:hypothetical protein